MFLTILGVVIGAIIAALVTISVENLRKPKLTLDIGEHEDDKYIDRPAKLKRAVRIKLVNLPLPWWAKWMSRNPALQCTGHITFHHLDGQNIFGRSMVVRWPKSPQPIPLVFQFDGKQAMIIDHARMTLEQRMDIYPGTAEPIDVACRFDNEEECFGWSNESYFSNPVWRNPNWKLSKGRFLANVKIFSSGHKCTGLFRLINDVDQKDFRLEKALPEDYDKIKNADK